MVDACMRELEATGYLSSRGRKLAAAYLALNLKVRERARREASRGMEAGGREVGSGRGRDVTVLDPGACAQVHLV